MTDEPIVINTPDGRSITIKTQKIKFKQYKGLKEPYSGRLYINHEDEQILPNSLINRKFRPYELYKREVLPFIKTRLNMDKDVKFSWSQRAGCSCPCSPGFIIKNQKYPYINVYVTVSGFPQTTEE